MNRLNRQHKDKVTQFRSITGASDKQAIDCLKQAGWSVEGGIEVFFSLGMQGSSALDTHAMEQLYLKYKDPHQDMILADGISRLCDDLAVEPTDIVMLVISYHMNAKLPELRAELADPARFQEVYSFAFSWAREKGQKCLQIDTALAMWQLLFAEDRRWQYIDEWCEFLQTHHNRAISRDTWVQLFQFTKIIKPDFSDFDEAGAWPYLMDEFVDYMKKRNGMAVDS
eukprot:GHRQ01006360.1.p2 GENE.GHRQ01006360.1~~GHRQ01006360.1.p2  ORF type:complete len:226 (+),score=89.84 GHRQ01006360.1:293-970(+)